MSEVEESIRKLETLRENHSREALRASSGDMFSYGRACGIYQGLGLAIEAIKSTLDESDEKPVKHSKNSRSSNEPVIRR